MCTYKVYGTVKPFSSYWHWSGVASCSQEGSHAPLSDAMSVFGDEGFRKVANSITVCGRAAESVGETDLLVQ